jgi:hypothetical protein
MGYSFDGQFASLSMVQLRDLARLLGEPPKSTLKTPLVEWIQNKFSDLQNLQKLVDGLNLWERNTLAFIRQADGDIEEHSLKLQLLVSGFSPTQRTDYEGDFTIPLAHSGLVRECTEHRARYEGHGSENIKTLYSDKRLLSVVGAPEITPFALQPLATPQHPLCRRSRTVILDVIAILQTIENNSGLKLAQNGYVNRLDARKIYKALHWDEAGINLDGLLFRDPVQAWAEIFVGAGLLQIQNRERLMVKELVASFAQRTYPDQMRCLLRGVANARTWWEASSRHWGYNEKELREGRRMLVHALGALPRSPDVFWKVEDFIWAVFDRIGADYTLSGSRYRYFHSSRTPEAQRQQLHAEAREKWQKNEMPWIKAALTSWMYFLGLVDLVVEDGEPTGLRISEAGLSLFQFEAQISPPTVETSHPAWVIQPNFDVIAYLDHATPSQLAFLERHAEREQSYPHTAHYRLTRETIYRGLEGGTSLETLLDTLQSGAQMELPQNVSVELHEWAALRERIVLRSSVNLIEFTGAAELQLGLARGLSGRVVAERFLLPDANLEARNPAAFSGLTRIDYAQPLPKNLIVSENGKISRSGASPDLIVVAQLNQWATPVSDREWQLTAQSVAARLKVGRKIAELLALLNARSKSNLPPLLEVALKAWAGESYPVQMEAVVVLRCREPEVFRAMIHSPSLAPLIKGYLPELIFVDPAQVEALRVQLEWLGCVVSDELKVSRWKG